jgi:hypothetical protein
VLALAGCAGGSVPKLDATDAGPLIALARLIAREGTCGQARDIPRLQSRVVVLVNTGRVPEKLQEPLASGAAALAELRPACRPGSPPAATDPPPLQKPAGVVPVPHAATPSQEARNLEAWLRLYSG